MNEAAVFHLEVGAWQDSLWSALKIAMGSELRGRGEGSFGSWVGPHPLPLPARPFVRKDLDLGGSWSISPHVPFSYTRGDSGGRERGKDWPAATESQEKAPDGRLSFSCCFSRAAPGPVRFALAASVQAQGLGIPGAGCGWAS